MGQAQPQSPCTPPVRRSFLAADGFFDAPLRNHDVPGLRFPLAKLRCPETKAKKGATTWQSNRAASMSAGQLRGVARGR